MKKTTALILVTMLMLSLGLSALAENDDMLLTVTGTASVSLPADGATMQLGAVTRGDTVAEAQAENDKTLQGVLNALKELGIDEKDMTTSTYNVSADTPYWDMSTAIRPPATTYTVTNMLNVVIRDLTMLPKAIDAGTKAGANQIYSLVFTSGKANEAYERALNRAVEDAQKKAQLLAVAAGKTLGELTAINSSQNDYVPYGILNQMGMYQADAAKSIVAGDVSVGATVTLVYKFK